MDNTLLILSMEVVVVVLLLSVLIINRIIKRSTESFKLKLTTFSIFVIALFLQGLLGYSLYQTEYDQLMYYVFPIEFFALGVHFQVAFGKRFNDKIYNVLYTYYKSIMLIGFFVYIIVASQGIISLDNVIAFKLLFVAINLFFLIGIFSYLVKTQQIEFQLFYMTIVALSVSTLVVIYTFISIYFDENSVWNAYIVKSIILCSTISNIGYCIFRKNVTTVFMDESNKYPLKIVEKTISNEHLSSFDDPEEYNLSSKQLTVKYEKSKLKVSDIEMIRLKIDQELVQNKLYLDPDLNLQKFSEIITVPKHSISQVFSSYYLSNFKEYVNKLRCEHAIDLMANYKDKHIIEIAYMCGFNSKTSFYRSFNKNFNISPTEYLSKNNKSR